MNILVPLVKILKIQEQMDKVKNFLLHECAIEKEEDDLPIFLQTMRPDLSGHPPFYVTLEVE